MLYSILRKYMNFGPLKKNYKSCRKKKNLQIQGHALIDKLIFRIFKKEVYKNLKLPKNSVRLFSKTNNV